MPFNQFINSPIRQFSPPLADEIRDKFTLSEIEGSNQSKEFRQKTASRSVAKTSAEFYERRRARLRQPPNHEPRNHRGLRQLALRALRFGPPTPKKNMTLNALH